MRRRINDRFADMVGLASLAALLLLAAPAPAVAVAPEQPSPSASPCAKDLTYLLGTWDIAATEPGAKEVARFVYEVRPLGGTAWIAGRGTSQQLGAESNDVWGRDASTGEIIRVIFDKSGTYALVRGAGWRDGRLVLEGDAKSANGTIRVRETISCINQDEFRALWEAQRNGVWSTYSDEHVVRRKS